MSNVYDPVIEAVARKSDVEAKRAAYVEAVRSAVAARDIATELQAKAEVARKASYDAWTKAGDAARAMTESVLIEAGVKVDE